MYDISEYKLKTHSYYYLFIKIGESRREHENALLNDKYLQWDDKVKYLNSIVSNTVTDRIECISKKSKFIQWYILMDLFKSYCCSLYGSIYDNWILLDLIRYTNLRKLLFIHCCIYLIIRIYVI